MRGLKFVAYFECVAVLKTIEGYTRGRYISGRYAR